MKKQTTVSKPKNLTIAQQLGITFFPLQICDPSGNCLYWEEEDGYWVKKQLNSEGETVYWEDSKLGILVDKRMVRISDNIPTGAQQQTIF